MARKEMANLTWTDVGEAADTSVDDPVIVVPVGSTEQHGPHLPLATDTIIATALARRLAAARRGYLVAPAIAVSASGEHAGFPGTLSIGTATTTAVLVELARSAGWARGVVFVNGHGGNAAALRAATTQLTTEGRRVFAWSPRASGERSDEANADLHAARVETSLLLALAPEHVVIERAEASASPSLPELVRDGVQAHSPSGVLGDPAGASAAEGWRLVDEFAAQLLAAVDEWERRHRESA